MELYQLKGFAKTARLGNLTKAAEELHLTQPALSIQIKLLEEELGELLFERRGRGLVLSAAGRMFLPDAEQVLAAADRLLQRSKKLESLEEGTVTIGTNDTNCLYVLPQVIGRFRNEYPGISIQLDNSHSADVCRWVKQGQVELGVITLPASDAQLVEEVLYEREDVLIYPPGHPIDGLPAVGPSDLAGYPFLFLHKGSFGHARLMGILESYSAKPERLLRVGSIEVIKRYAQLEMGISVIPRINIQHEAESGLLKYRTLSWLPKPEVGVIRRKNGALPPAALKFLEMLKEYTSAMHGI